MAPNHPFSDPRVKSVFDSYPHEARKRLLDLRALIFDVAATSDVIGELEESLKWGEPRYAPRKPRVGSPIRLNRFGNQQTALYFNCNTVLVEHFRGQFGDTFGYSKNRAIIIDDSRPLPIPATRQCIDAALTYHWRKRSATGASEST